MQSDHNNEEESKKTRERNIQMEPKWKADGKAPTVTVANAIEQSKNR